MKRAYLTIVAIILLLFSFGIKGSRFSLHGKPEGIYLLKGAGRELFELKDHLQLAEYERLIARVEFEAFYERWRSKEKAASGTPYLKYNWNIKTGGGYLINFFPDGSRLLTCLGRFPDADNNSVKGLFVGGGLPAAHYEDAALKTPDTGVAFIDKGGWHHLWGRTDETLSSVAVGSVPIRPGQWEFIGSEILFSSQYQLALKSSHLICLGNQSLRVDRYFNYHAGDCFFLLVIRFTNPGSLPLTYHYTYGEDRSSPHSTRIDLTDSYYIGLSGYQYALSKERTSTSGNMANFLSWQGNSLPDSGYLTTHPGILLSDKGKEPLMNNMSKGVVLQWNSRTLLPGQSKSIILAIGMAKNDQLNSAPTKPTVTIDPAELGFLLNR